MDLPNSNHKDIKLLQTITSKKRESAIFMIFCVEKESLCKIGIKERLISFVLCHYYLSSSIGCYFSCFFIVFVLSALIEPYCDFCTTALFAQIFAMLPLGFLLGLMLAD